MVGFDLGPLLQGQTRIAKLKSAYNLLYWSYRFQVVNQPIAPLTHSPELGNLTFLSLFLNVIIAVVNLIATCLTRLLGHL